ncbi:cytochrome d ubiquinol oxidase subunit II [Paenibacillus sp. KN14-4R]|uniref:cytochrome d ubiquinol oxidase subunit II n=1 Tax=Paenibacillus sp. KN14-4R TaxID=3445773 RepID=UPI003FA07958
MLGLQFTDTEIAITIVWVFLFAYSILGSIDFGTGFWAMVYGKKGDTRAAGIANRYLSPAWKITNVFLVLLVVALAGFFPMAIYTVASVLVLPVGLVLILLTIRSSLLVYAYSVKEYSGLLRQVSGITGLLIPGLLVSVLPATLGGFIHMVDGHPVLDYGALLTNPTLYAHLAFGLSTELFLSAMFLADYAREGEDEQTYLVYRKLALKLGPINLVTAVLTVFTMVPAADWVVKAFADQWLWFSLSILAFALGYTMMQWKDRKGRLGRPRIAILLVILQYGLASLAYGKAHMPYLIYPYLTFEQGLTNTTMLHALFISYIVSSLILFPVFVIFWRLFLKDKRYIRQDEG